MRPIFIIYLVTGLTLFFSLAAGVANAYAAHMAKSIVTTAHGDTLAQAQGLLERCEGAIAVSLILAAMQIVIIFSARKLNKQTKAG